MDERTRRPELLHSLVNDPMPRRGFILASAALVLSACAKEKTTAELPGVPWPAHPTTVDPPVSGGGTPSSPSAGQPAFPGVLARNRWAKGSPNVGNMNRMLPVRYVTIHHDGMTPFHDATESAAAARIELIRSAHRGKGWGDIGYHFIVDRSGRVWEGRPLGYQGAHVKDHNEGNIGVMALGNFDQQTPTPAQVEAVRKHVVAVMERYSIPASRVKTHQEWAVTACPGRNLQAQIARLRSSGAFA